MKRLLVLVAGLSLASIAWAGGVDGKDPHHSAKSGCASKDKVAKWQSLHGKGVFAQEPHAEFSVIEPAKKSEPRKATTNLDNFI